MTEWGLIIGGIGGSLATLLLVLLDAQTKPKSERPFMNDGLFWGVHLVGLPLAGGGLVWAYGASGAQLNAILAVNVGASAPLILRSLASGVTLPRKVD